MKLTITVIVRMPGKMCAALNQFFTRRHENEEAKLSQKNWAFSENIMIYYFCVSAIASFLKTAPGQVANVTNAFLLNTVLLKFLGYFLPLYTLC